MNYHFEYIEDYLQGHLSEEDRKAFEKAMQEDPELKSAVENHDVAKLIFDGLEEDDIRNQINQLRSKGTARSVKMWWRGIAASVALLLGFVWWMSQNMAPDFEQLYAEAYTVPVEFTNDRGDQADDLVEAFNQMLEGNEEQALTIINASEANDAVYAKAIFHMELKEFAEALPYLTQMINDGDARAYYYRGLCYLMMNQPSEAHNDFQKAQDAGDYRDSLPDLLKYSK